MLKFTEEKCILMQHNKKSLLVLIILGIIVSGLIGLRSSDVGRDTETYISYFSDTIAYGVIDKFEFGFSYLLYFISNIVKSVEFFFFIIALIITLCYIIFFDKLYLKLFKPHQSSVGRYIIFFTILLFSSWYYALTTNGIRQGVSIAFIYLALYYLFYEQKKVKFIILGLLAISFHLSAIVILPIFLFYKTRFQLVFIAWVLLGIGYFMGINELFIEWISMKFNIPIYQTVKFYAVERDGGMSDAIYYGFDLRFFIYTIFWPLLLLVLSKWKSQSKSYELNKKEVFVLIKIYFFLSITYFVLGFGAYSNRFAVLSWFLVPVLQFYSINSLRLRYLFGPFAIIPLVIGLLFFCFIQLQWFNVF